MSEQDVILAETVRKYPALYNKDVKGFKDKNVSTLIWSQIANELRMSSGAEAKHKFRNLRKRYTSVRKYNEAVHKSEPYVSEVFKESKNLDRYQFLRWLDQYIQKRQTKANRHDETDDDDEEDEGIDLPNGKISVSDEPDIDITVKTEDIESNTFSYNCNNAANFSSRQVASPAIASSDILVHPGNIRVGNNADIKKVRNTSGKQKSRLSRFQHIDTSLRKQELGLIKSLSAKIDDNRRDRDEFDIFGELVASKLRKLSRDTQEDAEMAINNILIQSRRSDESKKVAINVTTPLVKNGDPHITYVQIPADSYHHELTSSPSSISSDVVNVSCGSSKPMNTQTSVPNGVTYTYTPTLPQGCSRVSTESGQYARK